MGGSQLLYNPPQRRCCWILIQFVKNGYFDRIGCGSASDAWDAATWDSSLNGGGGCFLGTGIPVSGIGYCGSVALKASFSNVNFDLSRRSTLFTNQQDICDHR